jgi:hypothetical protein
MATALSLNAILSRAIIDASFVDLLNQLVQGDQCDGPEATIFEFAMFISCACSRNHLHMIPTSPNQ